MNSERSIRICESSLPIVAKKKHKPQVRCKITRCKMIVCKMIQFSRLQATSESVKSEKRINLKELPRPHKLPQSAPTKSVEGGVKISKTCLPSVIPLCLPKMLEEG